MKKAYRCPACGALDPILYSFQDFWCLKENCDWAFTEHDDSEIIEIVEIIDWEQELLTNNE